MNDERNADSPVGPEKAPDHGPEFWNRLDHALEREAGSLASAGAASDATTEIAGVVPPHATTQMPRFRSVDGSANDAPTLERSRLRWPAAAAAVAVVVLGLGFLAARGGSDPAATTEVVDAPSTFDGAPAADGSGQGGGETPDEASDPANPTDDTAPVVADGEVEPELSSTTPETATGQDSNQDDAGTPPTDAAPIPDFALARGAVGEPEYLPLDQGIPDDGTYLANWPERALTWYAVTDPDATCADPNYSEIRYVNGSGITQPIRDPQLHFSGEISHFVVRHEQNLAAWVVACGEQLELHVATLDGTGRFDTPTLVWLGEGSTSAALVQWAPDAVSLNAIEPDGKVFAVDYNIETGLLSRNGGPSRIMLEAGAPASRSLTPLASSPDGGLTYWQGAASAGTVSACAELFGSGRSDMLWLRQGEGRWQPAVPADLPVGSITAAALDSTSQRIAFGDLCPNESGRVVIGTQLPDGRIGDVITLDLAPFVPGFAGQLFWIDEQTLRIETDNSQFAVAGVRYDYRLDERIMVRLD